MSTPFFFTSFKNFFPSFSADAALTRNRNGGFDKGLKPQTIADSFKSDGLYNGLILEHLVMLDTIVFMVGASGLIGHCCFLPFSWYILIVAHVSLFVNTF